MSKLLMDVCEQLGTVELHQIDRSTTNKVSSSSSSTNCFSSTSLSFADLTCFSYNSSETGPRRAISFRGQLYPIAFFFSMNVDASEFFPSNETEIRSTTVEEEEELLCAWLKTDYQLVTAKSILHEWNSSTTLSILLTTARSIMNIGALSEIVSSVCSTTSAVCECISKI